MKSPTLAIPRPARTAWKRRLVMAYGTVTYLLSVATLLYTIGFVMDLVVPRTVSSGPTRPVRTALLGNLALLSLFGLQHSIMARPAFKKILCRVIPAPAERPTYCLATCIALGLLFAYWSPIEGTVWLASAPWLTVTLQGIAASGFGLLLLASFQLSHFELFGLLQPWRALNLQREPAVEFRKPFLYGFVRHPIYLGMLLGIWATPNMTAGHLLFAGVSSAYILVGSTLEEFDLAATLGEPYRRYQQQVARLVPVSLLLGRSKQG